MESCPVAGCLTEGCTSKSGKLICTELLNFGLKPLRLIKLKVQWRTELALNFGALR
jgi:hypothetical protein